MARLGPGRPDDHHHPVVQPPDALKARLPIVLAVILQGQVAAGEELNGVGEIRSIIL